MAAVVNAARDDATVQRSKLGQHFHLFENLERQFTGGRHDEHAGKAWISSWEID